MNENLLSRQNTLRGIAFFLGFTLVIPFVDAGAKFLILDGYHPSFVTWGRFFFSAVIIFPIFLQQHAKQKTSKKNKLIQIIRALFIVFATFLFFSSLKTTPLANAIGILFTYPILITLLAPIFLGEIPGKRRWFAVLTGFMGALLIIQPLGINFQVGYIFAIGSSLSFASYSLITRKLSQETEPITILGYQVFIGSAVMSIFLPYSWQTPDIFAIALLFGIGLISLLAHFLLIIAYKSAPAPILAPYGYFEIFMGFVLGFFLFKEVPDYLTWLGIFVVIASGIYTSIRENSLAKYESNEQL